MSGVDFSARATDDTTRTWLVIDGVEYKLVLDYSFTADILTLTDTGVVNLANPDGADSGKIKRGSRVELWMADPNVKGGASIRRLRGVVTNSRMLTKGGEKLQVQFADNGWWLEKSNMGLWMSLSGIANIGELVRRCLQGPHGEDLGWGFQNADGSLNFTFDNTDRTRTTRLNQGRTGIERSIVYRANQQQSVKAFLPPIQADVGQKIGQTLLNYARRARLLVNVMSDGALSFFAPDYKQAPSYRLDYHAEADTRRERNNIVADSIVIDDELDGVYTDVSCVTSRIYSLKATTNEDPNANKIRGRARAVDALPHGQYRQATFSDGDQIGKDAADRRALWFLERGLFDAWTYTCEVVGHRQGDLFWEPNTMVAMDDTVHGVVGNYYLQAVTPMRSSAGTRCRLVIKKANLLAA